MSDPFRMFLFETTTDAGDAGGTGEPAAEPAADPVVDPVGEPAGTGEPSADFFTDPRFKEAVASEAEAIADARLNNWLEELAGMQGTEQPAQPGQTPNLDPMDENFGQGLAEFLAGRDEQLMSKIDQRIQAIQAPLAARAEQETIQEGEQRLQDMVADDVARNGDLPAKAKEAIRSLADGFFPECAQRYGIGPRAAAAAILQASSYVRSLVSEAQQSAVTEQTNRLNTLAGVNGEPGSTTNGVVTLPDVPLDNRSLALKYGAMAKAVTG